jgi:multisubunit Na+/H+ antiporter MnhB subunit
MEPLWFIVIAITAISVIALVIVTQRAAKARKRGKPTNPNLVIALATFVMALLILLFTRFYNQ